MSMKLNTIVIFGLIITGQLVLVVQYIKLDNISIKIMNSKN